MKLFLFCLLAILLLPSGQPHPMTPIDPKFVKPARYLVLVTIDGVRWQEVFQGADKSLMSDRRYSPDSLARVTLNERFGGSDENARRQQLMPFLWTAIAGGGQVYGNRALGNRMNVANLYAFSYPGYHEMLTGNTDLVISSNDKKLNPHRNVLEYLNGCNSCKGKVAAFTSWDVFPYILGGDRGHLLINSGMQDGTGTGTGTGTRADDETFEAAEDYLFTERPNVLFLGLGETDDHAHAGRYDLYLNSLNKADRLIAELWTRIQSTPGYRDNTTLLITTDHGRGSRHNQWKSHGTFIRGSSQTWMALLGPGIAALGEVGNPQQLYQQQIASLIAELMGEKFDDLGYARNR